MNRITRKYKRYEWTQGLYHRYLVYLSEYRHDAIVKMFSEHHKVSFDAISNELQKQEGKLCK